MYCLICPNASYNCLDILSIFYHLECTLSAPCARHDPPRPTVTIVGRMATLSEACFLTPHMPQALAIRCPSPLWCSLPSGHLYVMFIAIVFFYINCDLFLPIVFISTPLLTCIYFSINQSDSAACHSLPLMGRAGLLRAASRRRPGDCPGEVN